MKQEVIAVLRETDAKLCHCLPSWDYSHSKLPGINLSIDFFFFFFYKISIFIWILKIHDWTIKYRWGLIAPCTPFSVHSTNLIISSSVDLVIELTYYNFWKFSSFIYEISRLKPLDLIWFYQHNLIYFIFQEEVKFGITN